MKLFKQIHSATIRWTVFALAAAALCFAQEEGHAAEPNIGVVNFRKCAENSKIGKREQASFEEMKTRMEGFLQEKEQTLNDVAQKLNDADYLDGISKEQENELKHKYRTMSQEMGQAQQQFIQMLQQANMRVVQMIAEEVTEIAKEIAESKRLDMVFNDEAMLFHKPTYDITDLVVTKMDQKFEKESKNNPSK